jgi:hypothetical protein
VNERLKFAHSEDPAHATDPHPSPQQTQEQEQPNENVFYKDVRVDHKAKVDLKSEDGGKLSVKNVKLGVRKAAGEVATPREDAKSVTAALPFHNADSLLKVWIVKSFFLLVLFNIFFWIC